MTVGNSIYECGCCIPITKYGFIERGMSEPAARSIPPRIWISLSISLMMQCRSTARTMANSSQLIRYHSTSSISTSRESINTTNSSPRPTSRSRVWRKSYSRLAHSWSGNPAISSSYSVLISWLITISKLGWSNATPIQVSKSAVLSWIDLFQTW